MLGIGHVAPPPPPSLMKSQMSLKPKVIFMVRGHCNTRSSLYRSVFGL